jgi:hypothetical protein
MNGLPIVCHGGCTNGGDGTIATIKNTAGSTGLNKASSPYDFTRQYPNDLA